MWSVLWLALVLPADAATTVYRCQDAKGLAVFSDTPCGADARTQTLREPSVIRGLSKEALEAARQEEPQKPRRPAKPAEHCPTPQAIAQAIFRKQVLLCMSAADLARAADPALRENFRSVSGADAEGAYEERYYGAASDDWPRYIKLRQGRVAEFRAEGPVPTCPPHCARQSYPLYPLPYPAIQPPRAPRYPNLPGSLTSYPAYPAYPNVQPDAQPEPSVNIQIRLGDPPREKNEENPPQP